MKIIAIISTAAAWFIGLILDVYLDLEPMVWDFRFILPILVMGWFILKAIEQKK